MKTLLNEIQMSLQDLAELLFEKASNVRSWVHRSQAVPFKHSPLWMAVLHYRKAHYEPKLPPLEHAFAEPLANVQKSYSKAALLALEAALLKAEHQYSLLEKKRQAALKRWHWAQHLPNYFSPEVAQIPHIDFVRHYLKKVSFDSEQVLTINQRKYGRVQPCLVQQQLALEQKIAGLKAEIAFVKQKLVVLDG